MKFIITGEDTRQRYWLPNRVIQEILAELLEDFVGIKILKFEVEREPTEQPESKSEDWV